MKQMNPWVYTLPRGDGLDEFDVESLEYEVPDTFIEENNHPGRMEDGQVCIRMCSGLWLSRRENAQLIFFTGDLNYGTPYPMNIY